MLKNCKILGCSKVTFNLPRDDQTSNYVLYNAPFLFMDSVTLCMWLGTDNFTSYEYAAAPNSYNAVEEQDNDNKWLVKFKGYDEISITVRKKRASFTIPGWNETEEIREVWSRQA